MPNERNSALKTMGEAWKKVVPQIGAITDEHD